MVSPGLQFLDDLLDAIRPKTVDISHPSMDYAVTKWLWSSTAKMNFALEQLQSYTDQLNWCVRCEAYTLRMTTYVNRYEPVCSDHLEDDDHIVCMDAPWDCGHGCFSYLATGEGECPETDRIRRSMRTEKQENRHDR